MHQTKHTPKITTTEPMSAPTVKTKPLQGQPLYHHRVVEAVVLGGGRACFGEAGVFIPGMPSPSNSIITK